MSIRLNASKLGTKEYWNEFYKREIENFSQNSQDTGECWFDDSDAERKMVQFLIDQIEQQILPSKLSFVDLGTGNGHLLFSLFEELNEEIPHGSFEFTGIDYSPESVEFAQSIAKQHFSSGGFSFKQVNLLDKDCDFLQNNTFDVLLDKGTLDAIALNQEPIKEFNNKIGMEVYAQQIQKLMKNNSILLITSCNFTADELKKIITEDGVLEVCDEIEYPSFQFGGVKGNTICSIAFKRKN